ncbi:MAG TPA: tetratricopeptide repeat protein [Desulfurivibrio alkaliphilus]|uniref:Tetratricopeptide repeat protein n=1 Tax=Desulfurivibrio alkaliphilus TaxID=427923 RepID=A0A7C2TIL9_9BACT|nr:tetratricopeptide repeat protein [Desulfurivibrio alkaliphilus]
MEPDKPRFFGLMVIFPIAHWPDPLYRVLVSEGVPVVLLPPHLCSVPVYLRLPAKVTACGPPGGIHSERGVSLKIFRYSIIFSFLLIFSLLVDSGAAESFPFRAIDQGDILPAAALQAVDSPEKIALDKLGDRPVVLAFWGADLPTKKQRSISALEQLQELTSFFADKKVRLLVINGQGDSTEVIREVTRTAGFTSPGYFDPSQDVYGALGVFVLPAVLLVDGQGRVVNGFGYGRSMVDSIKGEIEILIGEKTREQVEAELNPVMEARDPEELAARRHLGLGKALLGKGQVEPAAREFQTAIARNPKLAEAHIELGCVFLELKRLPEAESALNKGLALEPDSLRGEVCAALVKGEQGEVDEAIDDLRGMLFRNGRDHRLRSALGILLSKNGQHQKAAEEFRRAYELLERSHQSDD